ncbi:pentapeptide repeat-containing protein [Micromonospora sonneratiae]|uniref:Pentapeptide repeat-containing protein n=1 Tax=Micromonospora sonneratiae TaxID=1184706 RepID=A0ABW3Y925_9ACTN
MSKVVEGETFRNEDWYAEELIEVSYRGCEFHHVDLTEAVTRGAVFEECIFGNVRFNASRHTDSAFLRCVFKRCNLFEAEFLGCKLTGSQFEQSTLRPLKVIGGDWSFVALPGADLRGITIQGVRMREVDLTGANCADAVLSDVDLSGAQLHSAKFTRCDLRGSDLSALDPTTVELTDTIISVEQAIMVVQALGPQVRTTG